MIRLWILAWLCASALGLGILGVTMSRRNEPFRKAWVFVAFVLGPIFFFFVLPAWLDRMRKQKDS